MILPDNWGELLLPTLRTVFTKHTAKRPDFISTIYNVQTSTKAQEFNQGVGELGMMDEWEANGKKVSYEDFNKGFKSTYTHKKYSKGVSVDADLLEDDQYGQIKKMVQKLSQVVYNTTQVHAASVFNNAASSAFLGPDGKPLASTAHPKAPNSSSVISNLGTDALSATSLEAARNAMMAWVDDKDNLVIPVPDTLIVPTGLRKTGKILAETKEEPDTSDHGVNVWYGNLKVIEWPFLTSQTTWFLVDSARMELYLNWYWRRKPGFKDKVDFDTEAANYAVIGRWSYGFDDWSWVYVGKPA